jgi:DNA-binding beta-propeller fold protein YncE
MIKFYLVLFVIISQALDKVSPPKDGKYLYVTVPGVRNYLEYGGHGVLVFDENYNLVKRIPCQGMQPDGKPSNVKGVDVSMATQSLYITTIHSLQCLDLISEKIKWEIFPPKGCDRLSISPDGKTLYVPSFEKEDWYIVDAMDGKIKQTISPDLKAHNTIYGANGKEVYIEGLKSNFVLAVDTKDPTKIRKIGPFSNTVRPLTVDAKQKRMYVNVNDMIGFEVADIKSGKVLKSVQVAGYEKGPVKRHACPSHGIALNPKGTEVWVADAFNQKLHVYQIIKNDYKLITSISVKDQPGWITFSQDGKYAYPSTGEVIDAANKKIVNNLIDENKTMVQSEKMIELTFKNGKVVSAGDQFGLGR